jgi:hypothetical protein
MGLLGWLQSSANDYYTKRDEWIDSLAQEHGSKIADEQRAASAIQIPLNSSIHFTAFLMALPPFIGLVLMLPLVV